MKLRHACSLLSRVGASKYSLLSSQLIARGVVMAHSLSIHRNFVALARSCKRLQVSDPLLQCLAPRLSRSYATVTDVPVTTVETSIPFNAASQTPTTASTVATKIPNPVIATLYAFPSMEPASFSKFPPHQLDAPLRRDILHRAVVYEGDNTRQGTASTKHRTQVQGSSRKIRPQKGTGSARLSDRKSPSIRGGGVAHGPHPRDFATELPRKIYDLAWRIALSYRYRKGELIVLNGPIALAKENSARWLNNFFITNGWGKGNGRTLVVQQRPDGQGRIAPNAKQHLMEGLKQIEEHAKVRDTTNVDVKDLLSCGRIIIEKGALDDILKKRSRFAVKQ